MSARVPKRWEHEAVIDAMQHRLDRAPNVMHIRRQMVEHPFGTIKSWMGATHFLTRPLGKVRTEMSLHVLAYNLKRVIASSGPRLSWRRCGPETELSPIPAIRRPAYGSAAIHRRHLHPRQPPSRFCTTSVGLSRPIVVRQTAGIGAELPTVRGRWKGSSWAPCPTLAGLDL